MAGAQPGGQGNHGIASNTKILGVTAVVFLRQLAAGGQYLLPGFEALVCGLDHVAGNVDAARQRIIAHDSPFAGGGQRVLVIDTRPLDLDGNFTLGEVVDTDLVDSGAVSLVVVVDPKRFEFCRHWLWHLFPSTSLSRRGRRSYKLSATPL